MREVFFNKDGSETLRTSKEVCSQNFEKIFEAENFKESQFKLMLTNLFFFQKTLCFLIFYR